MKIIYNKWIPFDGFGLMNILGLVFSRKPVGKITLQEKRHEATHTLQQYELLSISAVISVVLCNICASWWYLLGIITIPFVIYILGWLLEIIIPPYHNVSFNFEKGDSFKTKWSKILKTLTKISNDAYMDNCFEREAYANESNPNYWITRHPCSWFLYILPISKR